MGSQEHVAIPVSNKGSLTPYVFYDYFIPAIRTCLKGKPKTQISLDMTSIESISPLVLPNLIIVGIILKEYFGFPVNIMLNRQNIDVVHFLYRMNFFREIDKDNLFNYDKDFVGGFSQKSIGDFGVLFCEPVSDLSPEEIARKMLTNNRDIDAFLIHFDSNELAEIFARTVGQLAHNSMRHGRSPAVISAYGGSRIGLHCAVSDYGIGYLVSLLEHPKDLNVYSESELRTDDTQNHFRAIIEAVFRRFKTNTYGLSSVIKEIAKVGGTTRVHSANTQIVFTPRNQSQYIDDKSESAKIGRKLSDDLLLLSDQSESFQSSPVRIRESKLTGAHIEFEIPPIKKFKKGYII